MADPDHQHPLYSGAARLVGLRLGGQRAAMKGWLRIDPADLRTKRQLANWVELGTTYARSLRVKR